MTGSGCAAMRLMERFIGEAFKTTSSSMMWSSSLRTGERHPAASHSFSAFSMLALVPVACQEAAVPVHHNSCARQGHRPRGAWCRRTFHGGHRGSAEHNVTRAPRKHRAALSWQRPAGTSGGASGGGGRGDGGSMGPTGWCIAQWTQLCGLCGAAGHNRRGHERNCSQDLAAHSAA